MKRKEIHFCFRVEKKEKKEELEYVPQEPVKIQSISNELFNTIRESLNNPSLGLNSTPSRTMNPPPEPPCKLFFFYNCCTKLYFQQTSLPLPRIHMNHRITTVIDPIAILIVVIIAIATDVLSHHGIMNPNVPVTGIIIGMLMV